jgi:hypothetical protein
VVDCGRRSLTRGVHPIVPRSRRPCVAVEYLLRYNMPAAFLNSVGLRCGKFGNYNVDKAEPVWGSRKDAVSWPQNPLNA